MKKTITAIILSAIFVAGPGCKKNDNNTTDTPTPTPVDSTGIMTCTISGFGNYRAIDVTATLQQDTVLTVNGYQHGDAERSVGVAITDFSSANLPYTKTFHFNDTPAITGTAVFTLNGGNDAHQAAYGTIVINSMSPVVKGTFSFTCTDSTKVTNGYFEAKQVQ